MADLERLLDGFKADHEAGRPTDLAALLDSVPAEQRQDLTRMLDNYLMEAPRRRWDAEAYEHSLAKQAIDQVYESFEGVSGTWPEVLPRLRNEAKIKRADLVRRLAAALGFTEPPQVDKIAGYYNRMEHGLLPADGVSAKVIGALADVVGSTAETIRASGTRGDDYGGAAPTFARTAFPDAEFVDEDRLEVAAMEAAPGRFERDEIDALFLDG